MDMRDISFRADDGTGLSGWLATPQGAGPHPLIVMTHGLSGMIDLGLQRYAEYFVRAGCACFAYDHRNWGRSGGWPRYESDPWRQIADMRDAISFARTLPGINPERIGLWGTSYAGGHVLVVAALDDRVRCLVSQVPFISGSRNFDIWVPAEERMAVAALLSEDHDARARGERAKTRPVALPGDETEVWARRVDTDGIYPNELTFRSMDLARTYEPGSFIERISEKPLLMLVADDDVMTPTEWQTDAFDRAVTPKRIVRMDCGHYDMYTEKLPEAAEEATKWFVENL